METMQTKWPHATLIRVSYANDINSLERNDLFEEKGFGLKI